MMTYIRMIKYHFTCEKCKLWWSVALDKEGWTPKRMWCPHCGHKQYDDKPPIDYELMQQ